MKKNFLNVFKFYHTTSCLNNSKKYNEGAELHARIVFEINESIFQKSQRDHNVQDRSVSKSFSEELKPAQTELKINSNIRRLSLFLPEYLIFKRLVT